MARLKQGGKKSKALDTYHNDNRSQRQQITTTTDHNGNRSQRQQITTATDHNDMNTGTTDSKQDLKHMIVVLEHGTDSIIRT